MGQPLKLPFSHSSHSPQQAGAFATQPTERVHMSTERDDSLVDNNTADVVDNDTNVVATDVYGPAQRDRTSAWQDDTFADLSLARKRDESAAEAEREQSRRHAEEMFDRRVRLADALNTIVIQTLAAVSVDTTVADTVLVGELVGIVDKLTTTSPPASK